MTFFVLPNGLPLIFDLAATPETKELLLAHLAILGEKSGCYVYFDAEKQALYVGRSGQLATRLMFQGTKKGIEKKADWHTLGVIFSDNPQLLEKELIMKLQPLHNKLSK